MKFPAMFITASLLVACGARSTDEERVRAVLAEIETAAEARDASDVLAHVAAGYEDGQGFDRAQLQNFLRGYFLANPQIELLVGIDDLQFPADGLAQAQVTITRVSLNDPDREHFKVEFRRDGDAWLVSRADRVRP